MGGGAGTEQLCLFFPTPTQMETDCLRPMDRHNALHPLIMPEVHRRLYRASVQDVVAANRVSVWTTPAGPRPPTGRNLTPAALDSLGPFPVWEGA
jgi:hypothetical protein